MKKELKKQEIFKQASYDSLNIPNVPTNKCPYDEFFFHIKKDKFK